MKLILASQSPRRRDLLEQMGYSFKVQVKPIEEIYPSNIAPEEVPAYLAKLKASAFEGSLENDEVLISSDTIVLFDGRVLGKPRDRADAIQILRDLSGKMHQVISGVCLTSNKRQHCFSEVTKVYFRDLTDSEINYYIDQYSPYDKAGAYAIQEYIGMIGITGIEGCYYNVMGLPLSRLHRELTDFNLS